MNLTKEQQGLIVLKSSTVSGFLNTPILNCAVGKIAISFAVSVVQISISSDFSGSFERTKDHPS